jgi:hypothetical protein
MDIRNGKIVLENGQDIGRVAGVARGKETLSEGRVRDLVNRGSLPKPLTPTESFGIIDDLAANVAEGMVTNVSEDRKTSLATLKNLAQLGLAVSMQAETSSELVRQAIEQLQPIDPESLAD